MDRISFARSYFNALMGGPLDEGYGLMWFLPGKESVFLNDPEDLAQAAVKHDNVNVYFGLCGRPKDFGKDRRGGNNEVSCMFGLCLDIDIANPTAHAKQDLPATVDEAMWIVKEMPLKPTLVVHSGYGIQVYWLYKEPWDIDNDVERAEAAALSKGWHDTGLRIAKSKKYGLDATHDNSRVYRVPGTFNVKDPANPKPVTILEHFDERRYNPDDFPEYFPEDISAYSVEMERDKSHLAVTLTRKPVVDNARLEEMFDYEPRSKATWLHRRKDLADTSLSSYDMSLAAYAVQCGWNDQEIADLIVSFRIKHGNEADVKKAFRLDYISRTIRNAKLKFGRQESEAEADKLLALTNARIMDQAVAGEATKETRVAENTPDRREGVKTPQEAPKAQKATKVSGDDKKTLIEAISAKLGLPIKRVLKYLADPPVYALDTALGEVQVGNIRNLIRLGNLQTAVAEAVGVMLPSKIKGWDTVAQAMLRAVEEINCGEDATVSGRVRYWLETYLDQCRITDDWEDAGIKKQPYRKDGAIFVFLPPMREYLSSKGDKVLAKDLAYDLKRFGCLPHIQGFTINGKKTTRSVYQLPSYFEHDGSMSDNPMADSLDD